MVSYKVTRWDISCCHHSHPTQAGYAESVILGITATDSESGKSAYKDERISISPCVELGQFEAGAEAFVEGQLGSKGWYLELQTRIAAQLSAPEPAPSGRVQPDFSKMTIGDGYSELPSKEVEAPADDEAEVVESPVEESPVEEVVEEAPKAAKKKAKKKEEEEVIEGA